MFFIIFADGMKIRNIEKINVIMKRMTQWVMTAALTFCGTMMMLTSCTDAIGTADSRWDRGTWV